MENKISEICLIAPTDELLKKSEFVISKYHKDIETHKASLATAVDITDRLLKKGTEIFISRRGTKRLIEKEVHVQVVEIELTLADYISVIEEAVKVDGIVAFFNYGKIPEDVRTMCQMLKIDARYYSFANFSDCKHVVEEALKDGAVLGIGGADTEYFAQKVGLRHLVVENSEESLLRAINTAEQLLDMKRNEQEKQRKLKVKLERYELVFNYTHDAIIAVDRDGRIDVLNEGAEKIMKAKRGEYLSRQIDEILPNTRLREVMKKGKRELNQLMTINGTLVSTNRIPIIVDGEVMGAVATFQDVKALQDSEQKIRIKLHDKGLFAKYHFDDIIGNSYKIRENISLAKKFAGSDATILIQGETGTGKELFAQSIHNASMRSEGPFVAVNCGSLPRNLLEAELFGYVEGAFTGASKGGKTGLFEMAHGGTIFLDEIGEMPLETQVQLLRVIQEKEIRRIGSDRVTPVNIRVITATNRDLYEEIRKKGFREDLYYRLNVLNIVIPPLRERRTDIIPIGLKLFEGYAGTQEAEDLLFVKQLLEKLKGYEWPGNVRELGNMMERAHVLLSQKEEYSFVEKYIQSYLRRGGESTGRDDGEKIEIQLTEEPENLENWEKDKIVQTLKENRLEIIKTAEDLGISRSTLWRKIKKYNIQIK